MKPIETRLTDLEVRYTEQEHILQQLDEIVRTQQSEIERLAQHVRQTTQRLRDLSSGSDESERTLADDKPPHY